MSYFGSVSYLCYLGSMRYELLYLFIFLILLSKLCGLHCAQEWGSGRSPVDFVALSVSQMYASLLKSHRYI